MLKPIMFVWQNERLHSDYIRELVLETFILHIYNCTLLNPTKDSQQKKKN